MTLDELLSQLRRHRLILISADECWPVASCYTRRLARAVRANREGLAELLASFDIRICPSPDLHRRYYRYDGQGRYTCAMCERLAPYI